MGLHWDGTITLGNVITFFLLGIAAVNYWSARRSAEAAEIAAREAQVTYKKDIEWRISNLETWRREHMIDSDARDILLQKLKSVSELLEYLVKERRRDNEAKRKPREGQY
jgi:hypothetical protein